MELQEQTLIQKCRERDVSSFDQLFNIYGGKVYQFVFYYSGSHEVARRITKEIFLHLFRNISKFEEGQDFLTYIFSIAVNLCRSNPAYQETKGEKTCYSSEKMNIIHEKLNNFADDEKIALILRDVQGFPYEMAAAIQNCPTETVKLKVSSARLKLKEFLSNERKSVSVKDVKEMRGRVDNEL